jgi:hypothetical protein
MNPFNLLKPTTDIDRLRGALKKIDVAADKAQAEFDELTASSAAPAEPDRAALNDALGRAIAAGDPEAIATAERAIDHAESAYIAASAAAKRQASQNAPQRQALEATLQGLQARRGPVVAALQEAIIVERELRVESSREAVQKAAPAYLNALMDYQAALGAAGRLERCFDEIPAGGADFVCGVQAVNDKISYVVAFNEIGRRSDAILAELEMPR